jgi:hypothetical protein
MDDKNVGCTLEPKTHLCSIAPNEYFQAVLMVDQADRNDVKLADPVRVKLDHMSHKTYIGHISEIAERHSEFCPPALSNKYGGDLATTQDREGRERLTSIAYQATVILDTDVEFLKNGLRGGHGSRLTTGQLDSGSGATCFRPSISGCSDRKSLGNAISLAKRDSRFKPSGGETFDRSEKLISRTDSFTPPRISLARSLKA